MSDNNHTGESPAPASNPTHELLYAGNNGQPMTADQRNERREALLRRQKEAREKAQQLSQAARANVSAPAAAENTTAPATTTTTTATAASAPSSAAPASVTTASTAPVAPISPSEDQPIRENMVQQAISFLSSPSVQSADEAKKTQFLVKKGLSLKEIELARSKVAAKAPSSPVSAVTTATPVSNSVSQQPQQSTSTASFVPTVASPAMPVSYAAPPPVPPRTYESAPAYPQAQLMPMYGVQQPQTQLKLLYPLIRGITNARQTLAVSQTELLSKLKATLAGYKDYFLALNLGSDRATIRRTQNVVKDEKSSPVKELEGSKDSTADTEVTASTLPANNSVVHPSTLKQLDSFSKKLETHANQMNFEQLKATRTITQDLAEYITKETYALTSSIAYPTSRYYGYNTAGAAASGKGSHTDPTSPEAALKSEIRSLKGLLLNWRNFPVAGGAASAPGTPPMS
ncbi:hypothetical protein BGW38_006274 [Lunasporangiospora selenospora]|uniref:Peroxisomal membrane protein PEX14 n=1 Tax=Lunasporangiospora selenospora TaxID=979761 RepID=A0A9P6G3B5_9FUNG|nr:hypothetical protein BGW38_006274 [Lunasporangiospora selenospora]